MDPQNQAQQAKMASMEAEALKAAADQNSGEALAAGKMDETSIVVEKEAGIEDEPVPEKESDDSEDGSRPTTPMPPLEPLEDLVEYVVDPWQRARELQEMDADIPDGQAYLLEMEALEEYIHKD